jgi:hypothetical protein
VSENIDLGESLGCARNGTFKIEKPFDEALDAILKVKPAPRPAKTDKK